MKNFVKLVQQAHEERYSVALTKMLNKKIPVAFLSLASLNQAVETVKDFRAQGLNITNLLTIDDSPFDRMNLDFNIVHINNAAKIYPRPEYVWVTDTIDTNFAKKFMGDCKIIMPILIRGKNSDQVYEIFMSHLSDLQEVYESFIDEESKKTFLGYWRGCLMNRIDSVVYANTPHYFLAGFMPKPGDIFIDGGCYKGHTATQFVSLGCQVYGFEMNKTSYNLTIGLAERKNFVLENLGLGAYEHESRYINAMGASRLDPNGNNTTQIVMLDSYVREKNLPRVDFIKLDVEGSELDVLKGATISISCWKPRLAISAYHKLDDLWTLMNFIKSIRPDYEFAMRQYSTDYASAPQTFNENLRPLFEQFGVDLSIPSFEECVLFAR